MNDKLLYIIIVVASVGVLSFLLRALPFLLFGTRTEPPAMVRYIGRVLSPAAIAMLVVYCFASVVPSLRGNLAQAAAAIITIALQLWKRNPLLSIITGTAIYMTLVQTIL